MFCAGVRAGGAVETRAHAILMDVDCDVSVIVTRCAVAREHIDDIGIRLAVVTRVRHALVDIGIESIADTAHCAHARVRSNRFRVGIATLVRGRVTLVTVVADPFCIGRQQRHAGGVELARARGAPVTVDGPALATVARRTGAPVGSKNSIRQNATVTGVVLARIGGTLVNVGAHCTAIVCLVANKARAGMLSGSGVFACG